MIAISVLMLSSCPARVLRGGSLQPKTCYDCVTKGRAWQAGQCIPLGSNSGPEAGYSKCLIMDVSCALTKGDCQKEEEQQSEAQICKQIKPDAGCSECTSAHLSCVWQPSPDAGQLTGECLHQESFGWMGFPEGVISARGACPNAAATPEHENSSATASATTSTATCSSKSEFCPVARCAVPESKDGNECKLRPEVLLLSGSDCCPKMCDFDCGISDTALTSKVPGEVCPVSDINQWYECLMPGVELDDDGILAGRRALSCATREVACEHLECGSDAECVQKVATPPAWDTYGNCCPDKFCPLYQCAPKSLGLV